MASQEIEALSSALARLPGLGPRSARRAVLWLVKHRESALPALLEALAGVAETLVECQTCGNVDTVDPCGICADPRRDQSVICVVESPADVAALETLLLRISDFVMAHADRIEEMDLNPVWLGAEGEGALPLDAVIIERADPKASA